MSTTVSRIYNFVDDKNNGVPITATRMDGELDQAVAALNQKVIIKATAPTTPVAGQLWLDSTNKILNQYRSSEWVMMGVIHVGTSAMSSPQNGDFWLDSTNNILYARINGTWVQISAQIPVGSGKIWFTDTAPTGWLLCDGSAVSRSTYAALFAVIGTTYGSGDGSTTFNLPSLKGKVPVGKDAAQTEFDTLGETGGSKTVDSSHTHTLTDVTTNTLSWSAGEQATGPAARSLEVNAMTANSGGSSALSTLQPYIVVNYIIKY